MNLKRKFFDIHSDGEVEVFKDRLRKKVKVNYYEDEE